MVVAASTSVEERRRLREMRKKLRALDGEIERLCLLRDADSLRLMREHLQTREQIRTAHSDLRDRIDRRLGLPG
jgi:hypothetical protein